MHPGRGPDLDADSVTDANPVADAYCVTDAGGNPGADAAAGHPDSDPDADAVSSASSRAVVQISGSGAPGGRFTRFSARSIGHHGAPIATYARICPIFPTASGR